MPTMEEVVERGESPQLRVVVAGNGGEAIRAGVEPLRLGVNSGETQGTVGCAAVFAKRNIFLGALDSCCNCHFDSVAVRSE